MPDNINNALLFLVNTVFGLYIVVLLLRYILQVVRADFYNPLSQFVWQVTNPPVGVLQRVIPRQRNHDIAALVLAYLLAVICIRADLFMLGWDADILSLLWWGLLKLIMLASNMYFFSILVQAIMSWVGPGSPSPANAFLWSINDPLLRPVREFLPVLGGLDFSPMLVLIALQMLNLLLPLPPILH